MSVKESIQELVERKKKVLLICMVVIAIGIGLTIYFQSKSTHNAITELEVKCNMEYGTNYSMYPCGFNTYCCTRKASEPVVFPINIVR